MLPVKMMMTRTAAVVLVVPGCGVVAWQSRGDHVGRYAPAAPEVTFGWTAPELPEAAPRERGRRLWSLETGIGGAWLSGTGDQTASGTGDETAFSLGLLAEFPLKPWMRPIHALVAGYRYVDDLGSMDLWDHHELRVCYRYYVQRIASQPLYLQAGASVALSDRDEGFDPVQMKYVDIYWQDVNLMFGVGARWRPRGGSSPWFVGFSVDVVPGLDARAEDYRSTKTETLLALTFGRTFGWTEPGLPELPELPEIPEPRPQRTRSQLISGGPRVGVTLVTGEGAKGLEAEYDAAPVLSLVGWHFECEYETTPTRLVMFVPFVGGMEQGLAIPIANLLFGLRTAGDWEFATGANLSPSGIGLTVAVGKTFRAGGMNLPIDFAIVSNKTGVRYSLTFGWNMRQ